MKANRFVRLSIFDTLASALMQSQTLATITSFRDKSV
jgi:hypothetical protein